jgi:DNA helicase HerA-like ATPase
MSRLTVIGLQGSGKTYLVKKAILDKEPQHLVIDPNDEYGNEYTRYIPRFTDDYEKLTQEIKLVVKKLVLPNCWSLEQMQKSGKDKPKRLKLLVIDEADLIAPARTNINSMLRNLIVKSRHLRLDIVFISRRPTDLNAYIMDTSDKLVVFKQVGYNALKTLRALKLDSDKVIKELDYAKHEFLLFDVDREYRKYTLDTLDVQLL